MSVWPRGRNDRLYWSRTAVYFDDAICFVNYSIDLWLSSPRTTHWIPLCLIWFIFFYLFCINPIRSLLEQAIYIYLFIYLTEKQIASFQIYAFIIECIWCDHLNKVRLWCSLAMFYLYTKALDKRWASLVYSVFMWSLTLVTWWK